METSIEMHDAESHPLPKWTVEESKLLIARVREQPELYDPKNSKFKLYKFTENIWQNFDLLFKKSPGACKDRWSVLRNFFRKEHTTYKNESSWIYYKEMLFLQKFLYTRGPSLKECIQKAMRDQLKTKAKHDDDDEEEETDDMITVMSQIPDLPDEARTDNNENQNFLNTSLQTPQSFTIEYPKPQKQITLKSNNFPLRIPKMEPIEIIGPQHMSTPIIPSKNSHFMKRSHSDDMRIGNVQIKRLAKSSASSQSTEHYTLAKHDDQSKSIEINRLDVSTTNENNKLTLNNSIKPFNFSPCSCSADGDLMFMQSLMPDIKKLKSKERMEFKLTVHQLLKDMLYKNSEKD